MWEISVKIPLGFGVGVRMAYLMIEKTHANSAKFAREIFGLKKFLRNGLQGSCKAGVFGIKIAVADVGIRCGLTSRKLRRYLNKY